MTTLIEDIISWLKNVFGIKKAEGAPAEVTPPPTGLTEQEYQNLKAEAEYCIQNWATLTAEERTACAKTITAYNKEKPYHTESSPTETKETEAKWLQK